MSDEVTIDADSVNRWIMRFHDDLNVSVDVFLRRQMRLCLQDCIRWTPPQTLAKGRSKVSADFTRASRPAAAGFGQMVHSRIAKGHISQLMGSTDYSDMTNEDVFQFQMNRAQKLINDKNYADFNALMIGLGGNLAKWKAVPFTENLFYDTPRTSAGGIKTQRRFIFDVPAWKRQLARLQKHVGRLKAGWSGQFLALGGSNLPSWVERHLGGARGALDVPNPQQSEKVITAINYALGVAATKDIVSRAVRTRAEAMRKEFKLVESGKKSVEQLT